MQRRVQESTRATAVGGEYPHHCAIPAFSWKKQEFQVIVSFFRHYVMVMLDLLCSAVFLELDDLSTYT